MLKISEEGISKGMLSYTWFLQWNIGTATEKKRKKKGKSKLIQKKKIR